MKFKEGDKVRVVDNGKRFVPPSWADAPILIVDSVHTNYDSNNDLIDVKLSDGRTTGLFAYRLEHIETRVEGETIASEDIRVGDEIQSRLQSDDLLITRQGVVAALGGIVNGNALWTDAHKRIDIDPKRDTYVLIKKGPEVDPVREKLKTVPEGAVVEFYTSPKKPILARKKQAEPMEARWVIYYPSGQHTLCEKSFADVIRDEFDSVRWLA